MKTRRYSFWMLALMLITMTAQAQNDVMMQAFYWDVPVDDSLKNGTWWDNLANKATELSDAGITGIWTPAPSKGNFGIWDMGYGIFDHYDLGNYNQKGTTETRFGSRAELIAMVNAMHAEGIEVYADIVLNHIYTSDDEEETNPAVKDYVFDEAYRNGQQYNPYPTNEIKWRIPTAQPGDYYIKIKGYNLDCGASHYERAYDVTINWDGSADDTSVNWESEPNNGGGQSNTFPGPGKHVWGHMNTCSDIDEYKVSVSTAHDLVLRLEARREVSAVLEWADQTNGYYPVEIWYNGQNLAASTLQARTNTGVDYVTHTGTGEPNYSWTYTDFHPVDGNDWLGYPGNDEVIPNTKFFGNDFNTYSTTVQDRLEDWGVWRTNTVGYDGYRLDFVRGFQESFVADWVNAMPTLGGSQRFVVAEYWGDGDTIKDWVNTVNGLGADIDGFDFPTKFSLTGMVNGDDSWDMRWLNGVGLVRGEGMSGTEVVTFVENHDTGKEHDKWITKDWDMAYAYMLFAEGRPTIFYPHFYGVTQIDAHDSQHTVTAPASVQDDIKKMIHVRKTYLGGGTALLSDIGNPWPSGDAHDVFVARRAGNGTKTGAILVLNNNDSQTKGLWVDNATTGYTNWANQTLVNALDGTSTTQVYADGRVWVSAPARGYAVYVPQNEYVAYSASMGRLEEGLQYAEAEVPESFSVEQNYPNPFNPTTKFTFSIPEAGRVSAKVYNILGQEVATLVDGDAAAGRQEVQFDASRDLASGVYYYTVTWAGQRETRQMVLMK